jgi:D-methionine transport system permease protein
MDLSFLSGDKIILLIKALFETLSMVSVSMLVGVAAGGPLGMMLYAFSPKGMIPRRARYECLSLCVNSLRSIPYIILTVLFIPITRLICGSSIGTLAAMIPLSLASILLVSRVVEEAFLNLPRTYTEIGLCMGAKPINMFLKILLPEAMPGLVIQVTTITINILGFSAMAGTVGGGGLGDLAIRYGYQRYDIVLVLIIVFILIALVQTIQMIGNKVSLALRR